MNKKKVIKLTAATALATSVLVSAGQTTSAMYNENAPKPDPTSLTAQNKMYIENAAKPDPSQVTTLTAQNKSLLPLKAQTVQTVGTSKVVLVFNQAIDAISPMNFSISGVSISSVTFLANRKQVELSITGVDAKKPYTLTTSNLKVNGITQSKVNQALTFGYTQSEVIVGNEADLRAAIESPEVKTIVLSKDITLNSSLSINRLVDLNLNDNRLTGDVYLTSDSSGTASIRGGASKGTLTGTITVDTKNADFTVNQGTTITNVIIKNIASDKAFTNTGKITNVTIQDADSSTFNNKGTVSLTTLDTSANVKLMGNIGKVTAAKAAQIEVTTGTNISSLTADAAATIKLASSSSISDLTLNAASSVTINTGATVTDLDVNQAGANIDVSSGAKITTAKMDAAATMNVASGATVTTFTATTPGVKLTGNGKPTTIKVEGTGSIVDENGNAVNGLLTGFNWAQGTLYGTTRTTTLPSGSLKYYVGYSWLTQPRVGDYPTNSSNYLYANTDISVSSGQHIFIVRLDASGRIAEWADVPVSAGNIQTSGYGYSNLSNLSWSTGSTTGTIRTYSLPSGTFKYAVGNGSSYYPSTIGSYATGYTGYIYNGSDIYVNTAYGQHLYIVQVDANDRIMNWVDVPSSSWNSGYGNGVVADLPSVYLSQGAYGTATVTGLPTTGTFKYIVGNSYSRPSYGSSAAYYTNYVYNGASITATYGQYVYIAQVDANNTITAWTALPVSYSSSGVVPDISVYLSPGSAYSTTSVSYLPSGTFKYMVGYSSTRPNYGTNISSLSGYNPLYSNTNIFIDNPYVSGQHLYIVQIDPANNQITGWTDKLLIPTENIRTYQ